MDFNVFSDEFFMRQAIEEAKKAMKKDEVPIGAVIVCQNQIIARAHNLCESLNDATAHAEMIAITSASATINDWRLSDSFLFVTKEPCPMCAGAIMNARVSNIYFGMFDGEKGCCGSLYQICRDPRFNHQSNVTGGIMELDCAELLKSYLKSKRQ